MLKIEHFDVWDIAAVANIDGKKEVGFGQYSAVVDNNNGTVSVISACPAKKALLLDNEVKETSLIQLPEVIAAKKIDEIEFTRPDYSIREIHKHRLKFELFEYIIPKYKKMYTRDLKPEQINIISQFEEQVNSRDWNIISGKKPIKIEQSDDLINVFFEELAQVIQDAKLTLDYYYPDNFMLDDNNKIILLDPVWSGRFANAINFLNVDLDQVERLGF